MDSCPCLSAVRVRPASANSFRKMTPQPCCGVTPWGHDAPFPVFPLSPRGECGLCFTALAVQQRTCDLHRIQGTSRLEPVDRDWTVVVGGKGADPVLCEFFGCVRLLAVRSEGMWPSGDPPTLLQPA